MSVKDITIINIGSTIEKVVINPGKPNVPERFALASIKSIIPTYNLGIGRSGIDNPTTYSFTDQLMITVNFNNESSNPPIRFDIQTVTNQPGWTPDVPGLDQAVSDIAGWITSALASSPAPAVLPSFGLRTTVNVTDVSTLVVPANAARKGVIISNDDGKDCWIAFGDVPVVDESIKIKKKETLIIDNTLVTGDVINAICKAGQTTNLTYQEAT